MFSSSSSTQSTESTKIKAVSVQTSTYGAVIPIVYGTTRVTGNLIWYGDFVSIESASDSGGK